ncbi:MAG TPA: lysophospholipid acyltransferase family protein [Solirubrobacteraceae bacterium]|nr:lysophospholipid acyltransferase family protein [Solirubrobacteraceae bacterium]
MNRVASVLAPLERIIEPKVYGVERIPERGALFVGNHTLFGLVDVPFMTAQLWRRRGIRLRGLGDHAHYRVPVWRNLLEHSGMVRGTRENARALMRDGQHVLVFPGGTNEVFHGRGQEYRLLWKERVGFARLAIEFGYPIVPFAGVGVEEMFDIVADERTPGLAQLNPIVRRLVGLPLPPIAHGIGPTLIPRPERLYFWFGDPIDTVRFDGRADDDDAARRLRDEVRGAVRSGIEFLLAERAAAPRRGVIRRTLHLPARPVPDPEAHFVARAFDAMNEAGAETAAAWMSRRVQLEDPPGWPGERVWRGRAAAIARLDQVTAALRASHVDVDDARSVGEGVLVRLAVVTRELEPRHFYAAIEIDGDEIVRIRVFLDEQSARVALSQPAPA